MPGMGAGLAQVKYLATLSCRHLAPVVHGEDVLTPEPKDKLSERS